MSTDFEKMMNDKMEQASVNDVLPDFDKDQIWDELSDRIPEKKKKVIPIWWTHAAAVVAGILIGSFAINMFTGNDTSTTALTDVAPNTVQQEVIVRTDTVFITKEIKVPAEPAIQQPANRNVYTPSPQTVIAKENKKPEIKEVEQAPQQVVAPITQEPVKETVIAKAKPKKVKPVHLLDIENEDRNAALFNNDPSAKVRSGFALQITTDRLPSNNASAQQPVIRGLLKRKK